MLTNPTLWVFLAGIVSTGILTVSHVNTLRQQQRDDRKAIDRLIRWKNRVNTVLAANSMPVPSDDDD